MSTNNYNLVLEIIESYDNVNILNDFKDEFPVNKNIRKNEYLNFCMNYIDDGSEMYYINLNWKYIKSGGNESVYDELNN